MLAALESLNKLPATAGYSNAAIACTRQEDAGLYQALARQFRHAGIPCEVFLETSGSITKQFVLAEKKGLRWIIIPGDTPLTSPLTLRDITTRQNHESLTINDAVKLISL
jgi:histidyl-tRNA synthetase